MAGEFDMQDGAHGMELWMRDVLKDVYPNLWNQDKKIYHYNVTDQLDNANQVGGYYRQS